MDTETLVENQIHDGQRLIDQLTRDEFKVLVAFWLKSSEAGTWQFYIASPSVDMDKLGQAYRKAYASLKRLEGAGVTPSDLKLLNGTNPVAQDALRLRDRYSGRGPGRFHGMRLGNIATEEVYIYPPASKWIKGFDEIKRNFPSAEVFTIPVLLADAESANLPPFMGCVNAETFEGRGPTTVLFGGFEGSSGNLLGELYFIHRPEGWNKLFRADTQRYEEVRHVATNEPPYRSVDFAPLAALRTQRKPGEDQIEMIKAVMGQGKHDLTLQPDNVTVQIIPCTLPAKEGAAERTLDWEGVRVYIQNGGRVTLTPKASEA
jgi:hypothetical protein